MRITARLKELLKRLIPKSHRYRIRRALAKILTAKSRREFERASKSPEWLGPDDLECLQSKYPPRTGFIPLQDQLKVETTATAKQKAAAQATAELIASLPNSNASTFLELGCRHALVSHALLQYGKSVCGIDLTTEFVDEQIIRDGVEIRKMDASRLEFEDESFDVVFSFNSFEHFSDPESVLREATRVTKTNGFVFLQFAPLYMSPFGLHAINEIGVPYCQLLFPRDLLSSLVVGDTFWNLNGWSAQDFRRLWAKVGKRLKVIKYYEGWDPFHAQLIARYPSCFRSKTDCFDDLIVDKMEILFQKIPERV